MKLLTVPVEPVWHSTLSTILEDTRQTSLNEDDWDIDYDFLTDERDDFMITLKTRNEKHAHRLGCFLKKVIREEFGENVNYTISEGGSVE